jgi:hypothetical protein
MNEADSKMTPAEAIQWLDWIVQNDTTLELMEEDGGLIMTIKHDGAVSAFVGARLMECIEEAQPHFQ